MREGKRDSLQKKTVSEIMRVCRVIIRAMKIAIKRERERARERERMREKRREKEQNVRD